MNDRSATFASASTDALPSAYLGTRRLSALFAATVFLSSALIFIVEPMFAKMILPLLGGTPAVWNTCVVFFQSALLAGYGYAHFMTTRLSLRQQAAVHGALLLMASLALPVALPAGWTPPVDTTPIVWLVLVLTVGVGAPFLMVSATAPLLQKWFAGTDHPSAKDPYFLYSASNVGSILALLSYPLLIEPAWRLPEQTRMWTVGYILFSGLTLTCAAVSVRRAVITPATATGDRSDVRDEAESGTPWLQRADWVARSFVPSSLLLGVTTYLSTDIASVPLLWAVPLTLYLLSFVFAFAPRPPIPPQVAQRAMPLLVAALVVFIAARTGGPLWMLIPLHLVTFFVCALQLHTGLARSRPDPRHLTEFYLWIAVGGVIGGLFNTFLAPLLFTGIVEYRAALVAACLLQARRTNLPDWRFRPADFVLPAAVGALTIGVTYVGITQSLELRLFIALFGLIAIWCFSFSRRPVRFGLALGMILLAAEVYQPEARALLAADRTFFGVLRVRANTSGSRHVLWHGTTVHGEQDFDSARRSEPLSYYHRSGPIGQVLETQAKRLREAEIGVVGLGAGSLAAYAQPGQRWTFYEIDPGVVRIARERSLFTYLHDCGTVCDVILGDARLSLERASAPTYRLLVLDAFSSDAIPVHLMTREALDVYLRRLEPDGILAFHISNRHLQLRPVLAALAAERGLVALARRDSGSPEAVERGEFSSEWFLMARREQPFGTLLADSRWQRPVRPAGTRIWTDDYSDILAVLRPQ